MIGGGIDGLLAVSVGSLLCLSQTRKEFPHVPYSEVVDVVCVVADLSVDRVCSSRDADSTDCDQSAANRYPCSAYGNLDACAD